MRFGGRLQAAIEVLSDIETRRRPVAAALKDWGIAHRFAGSGDRAAIGNLVYDVLRWRRSSAWLADGDDPRLLMFAMVRHRWGVGEAALLATLTADPHAPAAPTASEAAALAGRDLAEAPDDVRADIPEWLVPELQAAFGEDWMGEGEAAAQRPPLDLRVNRIKADRDKVAKALNRFGVAETRHAPDGLRVAPTTGEQRHPNLQVEAAFQKGWFEIQDEGSQLASVMTLAGRGEKILDLCAGGGGKTLALSALMENSGQVFATDANRSRLAPIYERLKRAGTRNVQVRAAGQPLDDLAGKLDSVLVDAPCTGTGTWRRRPDSKWRLRPHALSARAAEQSSLLDQAAGFVRPGGRLAYITCSFLHLENGGQVAAFVDRHPDFHCAPPSSLATAAGLDSRSAILSDEGVLLTPGRTGTDAFFVAVLERVAP